MQARKLASREPHVAVSATGAQVQKLDSFGEGSEVNNVIVLEPQCGDCTARLSFLAICRYNNPVVVHALFFCPKSHR